MLSFKPTDANDAHIRIFDLPGHVVYECSIDKPSMETGRYELSLEGLSAGCYILEFVSEDLTTSLQLLKAASR
jgi:hypothetical protein